MSRQGSIFYDAPEPLGALAISEEKDELGKMVLIKHFFLRILSSCFSLFISLILNLQVVMTKVMLVRWIVNYLFHLN